MARHGPSCSSRGRPRPREFAALAPLNGELVLFGGVDGHAVSGGYVDVGWNELVCPERERSAERLLRMPDRVPLDGKLALVGDGIGNYLSDVWTWDGANWVRTAVPSPSLDTDEGAMAVVGGRAMSVLRRSVHEGNHRSHVDVGHHDLEPGSPSLGRRRGSFESLAAGVVAMTESIDDDRTLPRDPLPTGAPDPLQPFAIRRLRIATSAMDSATSATDSAMSAMDSAMSVVDSAMSAVDSAMSATDSAMAVVDVAMAVVAVVDIAMSAMDSAMSAMDSGMAVVDVAMSAMNSAMSAMDSAMAVVDVAMAVVDIAMAVVDIADDAVRWTSRLLRVDIAMAAVDIAMAVVDVAMAVVDIAMAVVDIAMAVVDIAMAAVDSAMAVVDVAMAVVDVGRCPRRPDGWP